MNQKHPDVTWLLTPYVSRILRTMDRKPQSVPDVFWSTQGAVPIASAYRLVRELTRLGLLVEVEPGLTAKGRRIKRYVSMTRSVAAHMERGKLQVTIELRDGITLVREVP